MSKFKVGYRVKAVESSIDNHITGGKEYAVLDISSGYDGEFIYIMDDQHKKRDVYSCRFEPAESSKHPFKVGIKYFTRDKKSWRRFVGENLDAETGASSKLGFSCPDGNLGSRYINGCTMGSSHTWMDALPEEYTEPLEIDITRPQDYKFRDDEDEDIILGLFKDHKESIYSLFVVYQHQDGSIKTGMHEPNTTDIVLKER